MTRHHQPSPSEASTLYDDSGSWSIGGSSFVCSEDDRLLVDMSEGEIQSLDILPRGWSMRRGHTKKAAKLKMGKAAILAEIHGQGQEVSKGRAAFARSVNSTCRRYGYCDFDESKAAKRHAWHDDIRCETLDYAEETRFWEDCAIYNCDEEGWEWAPIDSYRCIEKQPNPTSKPVRSFVDKMTDVDKLALRLKAYGAILEKESFGKGSFAELQKQLLAEDGPTFCAELSKSVSRTIHVTPAPVSAEVQKRFVEARTTLSGALRPGYHGTNTSSLPSIYEKGWLIPGQGNGICVANGSAHGLGVYTAKVNNPTLSWNFCRAPTPMERRMMVCGILDDAPQSMKSETYTMGIRTVSHESQHVRHVGDAMVIFDDRRVAPFFEVSLGEVRSHMQAFDWARWRETVDRILTTFPAKKKHRVPLLRQKVKEHTAISYLTRRSASKRNPKIV